MNNIIVNDNTKTQTQNMQTYNPQTLNTNNFVRCDGNRIVNMDFVRWISQRDQCFYLCSKFDGCISEYPYKDTQTVCKSNNKESYFKLLNMFSDI